MSKTRSTASTRRWHQRASDRDRPAGKRARLLLVALAVLPLAAPLDGAAADPGARCRNTIASRLRACLSQVGRETRRCHMESGAPCSPSHPKIALALASLESKVLAACAPSSIPAAGLPAGLTPAGLVLRLQDACTGETGALAARSFGGPHAAVLNTVANPQRPCLEEAFQRGTKLLQRSFQEQSKCVRREQAGKACALATTEDRLAEHVANAVAEIEESCADLPDLIALEPSDFVARTAAQVRCLVATAHGGGGPLGIDCGPRAEVPVPAPATATRVVLDESVWGTRCGDGSPYAFWVRPAPAGSPIENVVVHMQGGGVCIFGDDCEDVSPGLFSALDDTLVTGGYMSNTNAANPFRDWTKIYLPYCTQDVRAGGGTTSNFTNITVHRFGALNVRAAMRYVRDLVWQALDQSSPEGFRPDRMRVVFGGTSAGGFGASYNYHYLLDDLRWAHTMAAPDSALGLDNGELFGLSGLGAIMISSRPPVGWGSLRLLPPYCKDGACAVVPDLQAAHSPRLEVVPEQRILNVSNQVDDVQRSTTFFDTMAQWIDAARTAYCATQGNPGMSYFLPAVPSSIHGILGSNTQFYSLTSDGVTVAEWMGEAISAPASVLDRVAEGGLVGSHGATAFSCTVD